MEKKPYYPTWSSTLEKMKKKFLKHGPKATVECLSSVARGVIGASAPGQFPRNEKQVTNMRKREKLKGLGLGPRSDADELFGIMQVEDPCSKCLWKKEKHPSIFEPGAYPLSEDICHIIVSRIISYLEN